ncbi:MAG: hypothetical protein AD742_14220 [Methylibium sp. NZG]|nr:MAG: hypothetical protein AD742_14220 [Methylibium sp. NZG]
MAGEGTGGALVSGQIEGFASVIVAGQRLDDRQMQARIEIDPAAPAPLPTSTLRPGMVVQVVTAGDGQPVQLMVRPEVAGPVDNVDPASGEFTVVGQRVKVDGVAADPTLLVGLPNLADLAPGDRVVVHGQRDATGMVRASLVLRDNTLAGVRVSGTATQIMPSGDALSLHGLRVDLSRAQRLGPVAREGDRLTVFSPVPPTGGVLAAATLAIDVPPLSEASHATVAGLARATDAPARWRVRGVIVDLSGLPPGDQARVTEGRLVVVQGRIDGASVVANQLRVLDDTAPPVVEMDADVGEFVDARRFTLRGVPVDAGAARFDGLTAGNLANGVPVRLRGQIAGAAVVATALAARAPADGSTFIQAGSVTDWQPAVQRLRLFGLPFDFQLSASTVFEGGTLATLADGRVVELRGSLAGNTFTVVTLAFASPTSPLQLAGWAVTVEPAPGGLAGELQVNEVDLLWDAATVFIGPTRTAADLSEGRAVRVRAVRGAGIAAPLRALEIDTRDTLPGVFRVRGTVSEFESIARFRIDGQWVDASNAVFDPPELARALAGAYIDVEGRIAGGVLQATRVSDP